MGSVADRAGGGRVSRYETLTAVAQWTDADAIAALCEEVARLRALLVIAEAKAANASDLHARVTEFADEMAGADGHAVPVELWARRLRSAVQGEW